MEAKGRQQPQPVGVGRPSLIYFKFQADTGPEIAIEALRTYQYRVVLQSPTDTGEDRDVIQRSAQGCIGASHKLTSVGRNISSLPHLSTLGTPRRHVAAFEFGKH